MVVGPSLPSQTYFSCRHNMTPSFPSGFHYLQIQVQTSNTAVGRQVIYMTPTGHLL